MKWQKSPPPVSPLWLQLYITQDRPIAVERYGHASGDFLAGELPVHHVDEMWLEVLS